MQFQGNIVSRTQIKNRIEKIWNLCEDSERYDWYAEARLFAESLNIDLNRAVGILAALSPLKSWEDNKRITKLFIEGQRHGLHTNVMTNKALLILESDDKDETILRILNGQKIKSFFINIRYPNEVQTVTIDRHALSIAMGERLTDKNMRITPNQYKFFNDCYMYTAELLGINPLLLQSATWVKWRKIK